MLDTKTKIKEIHRSKTYLYQVHKRLTLKIAYNLARSSSPRLSYILFSKYIDERGNTAEVSVHGPFWCHLYQYELR